MMEKDRTLKRNELALLGFAIVLKCGAELVKSYCLGSAFYLIADISQMKSYILLLLATLITVVCSGLFYQAMLIRTKTGIQKKLNSRLIDSMLSQHPEEFRKNSCAFYVSEASTEINGILDQYVQSWIRIVLLLVSFVFSSLFIASFSLPSLGFLYECGILLYILNRFFKQKIEGNQKKLLAAREKWMDSIQNFYSSFSIIRNYGIEPAFSGWLEQSSAQICLQTRRSQGLTARLSVFNNGFADFCFLALISFGMILVSKDMLSLAQVMMIMQTSNSIFGPVVNIHEEINAMRSGKMIYDKFMNQTKIRKAASKIELQEPLEKIQVSVPEFSFQDKTLLRNIRILLEPGKKYLFLGPSGCGKSTLLKMIAGEIRTDYIRYNDVPLSKLSFESLAEQIGYMDQASQLLPWTLEDNITLQKSLDEKRLHELLEKTDLGDVFRLHKEEIYPPLSGGELQRAALVRLLYQNRRWIVMDEPFSALDSEKTEKISRVILENPDLCVISVEHKPIPELLHLYDHIYEYDNGTFVPVK